MSQSRRLRRLKERIISQNFAVLGDLLMEFYAFLSKKPQPSDEEVRVEFNKRNNTWKRYCEAKGLPAAASDLFVQEVAASWEKKQANPSESEVR
jgi:hypothetical protein